MYLSRYIYGGTVIGAEKKESWPRVQILVVSVAFIFALMKEAGICFFSI